jgi:hypothetical protein
MRKLLACAPLLLVACGAPSRVAPAPLPVAPRPAPSVPTPSRAAPFESPGGLWMPEQSRGHAGTLERLGLRVDAKLLSDPLSPILSAVVNFGGCSASFVSKDGLIVTNHHCAVSALQHNSTPEENLLESGYLARTRAQ